MRAYHLVCSIMVVSCAAPARGQVRPGIEVLIADSLDLVRGKRLGLLSNHTGVDREGRRDADVLVAHGLRLTALFSPEHGFRGTEDRPGLPDAVDSATGLPIYSLYGGSRTAALAALDSLDVLLVDLQDIGARYYTYIATTASLMRDAAARGKRVVVLDRPDPIGGEVVQGNMRAERGDPDRDPVGFLPVPMRHGMTLGELARMANDVLRLQADLTVVPAAGWKRKMYYDATKLPWVKPSPNMPELESAMHYPGLCLFEGTNVSVGRGTSSAFQLIGAPWLTDPKRVIERLLQPPSDWRHGGGNPIIGGFVKAVRFVPEKPSDGKYDGIAVMGLQLRVTDRRTYDPTRFAVAILAAVRMLYPTQFEFRNDAFDRLAGGPELRRALESGREPWHIWKEWEAGLSRFRRDRAKYLLY